MKKVKLTKNSLLNDIYKLYFRFEMIHFSSKFRLYLRKLSVLLIKTKTYQIFIIFRVYSKYHFLYILSKHNNATQKRD